MSCWFITMLCLCVLLCFTMFELSGFGILILGLEVCFDIQLGTLEPYGVCGFCVFVHFGEWYSGSPFKVFDSGCMFYLGDQVMIDYILAGINRMVYYEMYPSLDCSDIFRFVGVRGGVDIFIGVFSVGIWYVFTFEFGGFRGLFIFDFELCVRVVVTLCVMDEVCLGVDEENHYILSLVVSCDIVVGHC